jgi:hypothetical protein
MSISEIRKDKLKAFLIITICLIGYSFILRILWFVSDQSVALPTLLFPLLYYLVSNWLIKAICPHLSSKQRLMYILILPFMWIVIIVAYFLFVLRDGFIAEFKGRTIENSL